jgi:hypothetical protein
MKNVKARAGRLGGKARAQNLSPKQLSEIGKKANRARNRTLSREQRKRLAKRAARARWKKQRESEEK